jgi:hypothetical protein
LGCKNDSCTRDCSGSPSRQSFFLFGPRGTGKTAWLRSTFPEAVYFDLLDAAVYTGLLGAPERLGEQVPWGHRGWVVVDEVQRVPEVLNEVHRLIESRRLRFALTGSSARKLRRRGVNLLAGRAVTRHMHPLTAAELGRDFDLKRHLRYGCLPYACTTDAPKDYLTSYVSTYLREEVLQEGLTRNVAAFARFMETASFSQGAVLNMAAVARECGVNAKVAEDYFSILEDLLVAVRLPPFTRRAKRRLVSDGDVVFQPRKIERSGLLDAVERRVFIYVHKEQQLDDVEARFPARHYVLVDDKIRILTAIKAIWGSRLTTVFPRQGHYAHAADVATYPTPDIVVERIGDLLQYDLAMLRGAARPAATAGRP